jgi:hypothetical protein
MVCQRSRDSKPEAKVAAASPKAPPRGAATEPDPATPPGTLDSLEGAMTPASAHTTCAASVTDDSRSEDSLSDDSPYASNCGRIPQGITTDKEVVAMSLQRRDEMESLRVAKAMLYESFIQALANGNRNV